MQDYIILGYKIYYINKSCCVHIFFGKVTSSMISWLFLVFYFLLDVISSELLLDYTICVFAELYYNSFQRKKSQSQSKPQIESSRSRQEESTSGSTRNSEAVKEVSKEIFDRLHQRGVYSGPLTRASGWSNGDRKLNDPPSFSRPPNLTTLSSPAPSRSSAVEDNRRRFGFPQNKKALDAAERYSGPINDLQGEREEDWHQLEEKTRVRRPAPVSFQAFPVWYQVKYLAWA